MEQGGSGRPVLVLVATFPEGLESPAEPEKVNFQYMRIPCYIISIRYRNGSRDITAGAHTMLHNSFARVLVSTNSPRAFPCSLIPPVSINCAGATAAVWIQCANTFPGRATSVPVGPVVKQVSGRHLLTSAAISFHFCRYRLVLCGIRTNKRTLCTVVPCTRRYAPQRMPLKCPTL